MEFPLEESDVLMRLSYNAFLLSEKGAFNLEFVGFSYFVQNWFKMLTLSSCLDVINMNNKDAIPGVTEKSRNKLHSY